MSRDVRRGVVRALICATIMIAGMFIAVGPVPWFITHAVFPWIKWWTE